MYVVLNRFLLSHQSLDFRRVPEFFKLFYGFDLEVNQSQKTADMLFRCFSALTLISIAELSLNKQRLSK